MPIPLSPPTPPGSPRLFPHGFTLVVTRYGQPDRFGNRPPPTEHVVEGCAAAPAGSQESTGATVSTLENDTIYTPFDADVRPTDELTVPEGQPIEAGVYQVEGKPQRWRNPFSGDAFGTVINLTRTG